MKSKLGFHIDINTWDGQIEKMLRARPKIVKSIENMGLLNILHEAFGNDITLIARAWKVGDDFLRFSPPGDDPKQAAQRWLYGMRSMLEQAPYAYWESFNEMSNWDHLSRYSDFEAERQRLMAAEGYKACIGNFAAGTPEIVESGSVWHRFYTALAAANEYHNLLGLHEYGGLWMDLWYGQAAGGTFSNWYTDGWLFARYRQVWKKHIIANDWRNVRIALTEFGLDMVGTTTTSPLAGYTVGAWKTCFEAWRKLDGRNDGPAYYAEQLMWADRQMQMDPYVVGATIFTWGTFPNSLWVNHDINGECADRLVDYIAASTDSGWVVASPTGVYVRVAPLEWAPVLATLGPGASVTVLEVRPEWLKVRTPSGVEGWTLKQFLRLT